VNGRWKLLISFGVVALMVTAVGAICGAEDSSDQRFLAGLRDRGLFRLAETYCLDRLKDPQLSEQHRAELVIELSLTLADRAVNSPPEQRQPLWQQAQQVVEDFVGQYPDSAWVALVRFQGALGLLARGELARQESEVVVDKGPLLEEAKTHLRAAIDQLETLAGELRDQLRRRGGPGRVNAGQAGHQRLTDRQLTSLQRNVQYQLARGLRNQALCFPADSDDRSYLLTQADGLLGPLARLDLAGPLAWTSRIDEIVCRRLLADYTAAGRKLDALEAEKPPPAVALRARAERLRLALATGELGRAVRLLSEGRELEGVTSGELDYARLETCLRAWRAASQSGDGEAATQWQTKATEMVQLIERLHGPYWRRRAEMLLAGYVTGTPGGNLEMRVRAAESSYRSGRFDDALDAYDRAGSLAVEQGDAARAFQLAYVAATIEHQRGRHAEAMSRYRQLAVAMPTQPKAPEAHLLAVYHAEQIAKAQSPGSLKQYVELLEEHLQHWPEGPTADQVRWRLGRLREHQRDWQDAIAAYRAISADYPQYVQVVEAAARCYQAWLDDRRAADESGEQVAAAAAEWFESLIVGPQERLPERWSPVAQAAALAAARLWLHHTPSGFARAERILSAALDGAPDAPPEWTSTVRAMLVFALAGQGRRSEAAAVMDKISAGPPDQLLAMLEGLARVAAPTRPQVPTELAELEWRAVELLNARRDELSEAGRESLDRLEAQTLADAGRIDEALEAYRRLSAAHPRDGRIQEAYARLLTSRADRASLETALAKWRDVEKKSPPGSDRWFRAKYEVALLHYRLGNPQQTEKIISLLQVLHPELGGPAMKGRFLVLLERSRRKK